MFEVVPFEVKRRYCSRWCAALYGADKKRGTGSGADIMSSCTPTPSGCLEWQHYRNSRGYGITWVDGERMIASRAACLAAHGAPPADKPFALHSCDNPPCCNPDHLRWGSLLENSADARERGNSIRGERHHNAVLTEHQVRALKRRLLAGEGGSALAREYGVSVATVCGINKGHTWKHVVL